MNWLSKVFSPVQMKDLNVRCKPCPKCLALVQSSDLEEHINKAHGEVTDDLSTKSD